MTWSKSNKTERYVSLLLESHCLEEEVLGKAYDSRLMRRLLTYLRPYKLVVAASLALLLIDSLLQIIGPLLTKLAVDKYLVPVPHPAHALLLDTWLSKNAWSGLSQLAGIYM